MSATLTPPAPTPVAPAPANPPPVSGWPRPLRWTVDLFHAVNATGVFEGRRPMLIHGILFEQGPMKPPHATATDLVAQALRSVFATGWLVREGAPLVLGLETDPRPDVMLLPGGPRDYSAAHPTTAALVVEVNDTTLASDTTKKAELYATAGIPDYWVLDLNGRVLHVYRDPAPLPAGLGATTYGTRLTLGPADAVSPLSAPHSSVTVADLLP